MNILKTKHTENSSKWQKRIFLSFCCSPCTFATLNYMNFIWTLYDLWDLKQIVRASQHRKGNKCTSTSALCPCCLNGNFLSSYVKRVIWLRDSDTFFSFTLAIQIVVGEKKKKKGQVLTSLWLNLSALTWQHNDSHDWSDLNSQSDFSFIAFLGRIKPRGFYLCFYEYEHCYMNWSY